MWVCKGPSASKPADEEAAEVDDTKFDSFMGNDTGAFAFGEYDKDDKEADEVGFMSYAGIFFRCSRKQDDVVLQSLVHGPWASLFL